MRDRASGVHPDILEHLPPKKTRVCLLYCFVLSPVPAGGGGGGGGGSPYAHMGSYQYHASGLNNVPFSAKSGYDLGYTAAYTSYAPYGTSSSPANNEPGMLKVGITGAKSV